MTRRIKPKPRGKFTGNQRERHLAEQCAALMAQGRDEGLSELAARNLEDCAPPLDPWIVLLIAKGENFGESEHDDRDRARESIQLTLAHEADSFAERIGDITLTD